MSFDLYFSYLQNALSRYSIDELVKVWYDSYFFKKEGEVLRKEILDFLPSLSEIYKIEIDEGTTFHFVREAHSRRFAQGFRSCV